MSLRGRSVIKLRVALAVAAVAVPIAAMSFGSPAAGAAPAHAKSYYLGVSGVNFTPGKAYSPDQVRQMQQAALPLATHRSAGTASSTRGVVTPFAVASGFVLYNPGYRRTDYVYDSNWGPLTELYCSGTCTQVSKYQTQLHESINGGYSKLWILTFNVQHLSGNYASDFKWWYACAINVSGSPDHYCTNGADPSQVTEPMGSSGTTLYEYFENNNYPNIEYPMVGLTVDWGSVSAENKNRGFDVCASYSTTKLCSTSGNGS